MPVAATRSLLEALHGSGEADAPHDDGGHLARWDHSTNHGHGDRLVTSFPGLRQPTNAPIGGFTQPLSTSRSSSGRRFLSPSTWFKRKPPAPTLNPMGSVGNPLNPMSSPLNPLNQYQVPSASTIRNDVATSASTMKNDFASDLYSRTTGYPPPTHPQQGYGHPPQQHYPPQQGYGHPPQQGYGYPPQQQYPPQQDYGYPPQQDSGYPPQQDYGYPPQQQYPPDQYPSSAGHGNPPYPLDQPPGTVPPPAPGHPPGTGHPPVTGHPPGAGQPYEPPPQVPVSEPEKKGVFSKLKDKVKGATEKFKGALGIGRKDEGPTPEVPETLTPVNPPGAVPPPMIGGGGQPPLPGLQDIPGEQTLPHLPEGATSARMQELISVLKKVHRGQLAPTVVKLEPSVATLVTEAGPDHLGHDVDDLSRSLSLLTKASKTYLVPERISTMTTEDVPEVLTPVAKSLKEVLDSAATLRHRLDAIAQTSNLLLGRASSRAEERLGLLQEEGGVPTPSGHPPGVPPGHLQGSPPPQGIPPTTWPPPSAPPPSAPPPSANPFWPEHQPPGPYGAPPGYPQQGVPPQQGIPPSQGFAPPAGFPPQGGPPGGPGQGYLPHPSPQSTAPLALALLQRPRADRPCGLARRRRPAAARRAAPKVASFL